MTDEIPQWSLERAWEEAQKFNAHDLEQGAAKYWIEAFARYIAGHEEPPVDPIDELVELLAPVLTQSQGMAATDRERRFREAIRNLVSKDCPHA